MRPLFTLYPVKRRLIALCALALILGCNQQAATDPGITDLADTGQLAADFNSADTNAAQLILLLSPT